MERHEPVQVLLATYNGERYLAEQIDSILAQAGVNVEILASDDGSTDATLAILKTYEAAHRQRFRVLPPAAASGHASRNFRRLLQASSRAYVAFADQDDVWHLHKLQSALRKMQGLEEQHGADCPLLVFSDAEVADEGLRTLLPSIWKSQQLNPANTRKLPRLLMQNVVTGCTALMNRQAAALCECMPDDAAMHDWWLALVVCAFGNAAWLCESTVVYRQHSSNAVGAVLAKKRRLLPRLREHGARQQQWETAARQGAAFLRTFSTRLQPAQRHLLEQFVRCDTSANRFVRVALWLRYRFFQSGLRNNLAMLWYLWDMKIARGNRREGTAREQAS